MVDFNNILIKKHFNICYTKAHFYCIFQNVLIYSEGQFSDVYRSSPWLKLAIASDTSWNAEIIAALRSLIFSLFVIFVDIHQK